MADWSSGYYSNLDYTFGAYGEMNPLFVRYCLANAGYRAPEIKNACELGFGHGLSMNISAASSSTSWHGTDFIPSQAAYALELNDAFAGNSEIFDYSFEEFLEMYEHPKYDLISLHGVWSWVSQENRNIIMRFIRKFLNPNGVVYISYNTKPGWASFLSLRDIMLHFKEATGSQDQASAKVQLQNALNFATQITDVESAGTLAHPTLTKKMQEIKSQPINYIAHEYFNKDWHPMGFDEVSTYLEDAKLSFATSAEVSSSVDAINLTMDQKEIIDKTNDITLREMLNDFFKNRTFRKDYWIRGNRKLSISEKFEEVLNFSFVATSDIEKFDFKLKGPAGEASLSKEVYGPILEQFGQKKMFVGSDLFTVLHKKFGLEKDQLVEAISILTSKKTIFPANKHQSIKSCEKTCNQLNKKLIALAKYNRSIKYLASPVTGSAVNVNFIDMLFTEAVMKGHKTQEQWSNYAWGVLQGLGEILSRDGKPVDSLEENLQELRKMALRFENTANKLKIHRII